MDETATITATNASQAAAEHFPADQFVCLECVPVYREHTDADGFTFDRAALAAVTDCCNRRIRETGDYCPLTDGHTPLPYGPKPLKQPDVLGYAGPFYLIRLGDEKPFWAIATNFYIPRESLERVRKLPRRSVEIWKVGDDPANWFFDPIALLGAITPKLDLGLAYSRTLADRVVQVRRYEAGFPSPTAVFIPTNESDKRRNNAPEKPPMALDDSDLQKLIGAFDQLDWVQWAKKKMAEEAAATPAPGEGAPPPDANAKTRNEMSEANVDPSSETPGEGKVVQNSRDGVAERYARIDRDNRALTARVNELERANIRVRRETKIDGLRLEYAFDEANAKKRAEAMTDEQFADWCADVVKHYARIPQNEMLSVQSPASNRIGQEFTATDRQAVIELCGRENISWAEGLAKHQASKT
ncbi:MAG: hypothetical protein AB7U73_01290 [Pirellulales bacterium]